MGHSPRTARSWAVVSLVLSACCVIFSFIDYIDNGVGPSCQTIRRKFFLACNNEAPACTMQWPWWVPTFSLSTYSHFLIPLSCWPCWQRQTAAGTTSEPRRKMTPRPRTGTNRSHGRCNSVVAGEGEYEGNNMQLKLTNGTKSPWINCSSNLDKTQIEHGNNV